MMNPMLLLLDVKALQPSFGNPNEKKTAWETDESELPSDVSR
jgi:hypothetical protein